MMVKSHSNVPLYMLTDEADVQPMTHGRNEMQVLVAGLPLASWH